MRPLILLALACLSGPALGQVYKCTASDGKVTYSSKPCPDGKALNITPNAVGEVDQSAARAERKAVERRIAAREAAEQAAIDQRATDLKAKRDECQAIADKVIREEAWLNSISEAVRSSAQAEIAIQRRLYSEKDCRRYL